MKKLTNEQKHLNCPTVIFWKDFKGQEAVPGLYCSKHIKWIKWLTKNDYKIAISLGIQDKGKLLEKKPEPKATVDGTKLRSLLRSME